jgi:hypothetical protein
VDVSKNGGSLVHYSKMLPVDFSKLLRKCQCARTCRVGAIQHLALRSLGYPYVYNYTRFCNDRKMASSVVEAAERAYNNPFPFYIPSQHSLGTVLSQVCTNLIERTALCDCARFQ